MKKLFIAISMLATYCVAHASTDAEGLTLREAAITSAAANSLTAYLAVADGAREVNPAVPSSAAGLVLMTGLKWGAVELVEKSDLEPATKKALLKSVTAAWGGLSISNLMVLLSASNPLSLVAGLAGGTYLRQKEYAEESAANSAR